MKVLVTGAAGKLGSAVCSSLRERGHEVRATDRRYRPGLEVELKLADLCSDLAAYELLAGMDAVAHIGNHPNVFSGPPPQRILSENTAMNANVFRAAADLGVRRIAFASSVQVMLRMPNGGKLEPPYPVPYLPLDGAAPRNPGINCYALSKELAERLLEEHAREDSALSATSLRFPMLLSEQFAPIFTGRGRPVDPKWLNFGELLGYLMFSDAAALIVAVLEAGLPGYHQQYPALSLEVKNRSVPSLIDEFYPHVELRRPVSQISSLIDISGLQKSIAWDPKHHFSVEMVT
ncbi:MAG TPA: NAD(P)-dependent oxidoreductase [Polyangiaceae bacterium]|jgi:nucleoside-diphosphate-sugar epimerase